METIKCTTVAEFRIQSNNYVFENDYHNKMLTEHENRVKELNLIYPCLDLVQWKKTDNGFRIELCFIELITENTPIKFRLNHSQTKGKYNVWSDSLHKFKNLNYREVDRIAEVLETPKKLGVLTAKKIQAWIDYFCELYALCLVEDQKQTDKVETFLNSLEGLNAVKETPTKGYIVKNGIKFQYEINNGCISTSIKLDIKTADLETFINLSNNNY